MQLGTFTPRERGEGDSLPANEAVGRLLVVLVREHRTGIVTKFKPAGADGVNLDIADVAINSVWLDVLWMNGAVVDNLAAYVGQPVAVKLVWVPSAKGGNPYIGIEALQGAELAQATAWVAANTNRFDLERQQRAAKAQKAAANGAPPPADPWTGEVASVPSAALAALQAQLGTVPATPPAATLAIDTPPGPIANIPAQVAQQWAQVAAAAQQPAPVALAPAPVPRPAPAAVTAPAAPVNINDPAVQALLAQIAAGQVPPAA